MLKRERERVQGIAKPQSSDTISERRQKDSMSRRNVSRQNSLGHEVSSELSSQALEERQQPVATREEANGQHNLVHKTTQSQQMKDEMSQGRREAFEVFRAEYTHNGNIEENKRTLKQRYSEAKSLGEQVNNSRKKINTLKTQIEQHRIRRSMQVEDDSDNSEEERLRNSIEDEKLRYKDAFTGLRSLKTEIEHLQHLMEKSKVQMQKDFEVWWNEQSSLSHKSHKQTPTAWKTPTPPLSPIKPQETRPRSSTDPRSSAERSSDTLRSQRLQTEARLSSGFLAGGLGHRTVHKQDSTGSEKSSREDNRFTEKRDIKNAYEDAKRFSSSNGKSSFNLTGDSRADEDILAFIQARQALLDQRGSNHK